MGNEFDNIIPNTQTPRMGNIGTSNNKWGKIYGVNGYYDSIIVSGIPMAPYDNSVVQASLGSGVKSIIVNHNLGTEFVDVQVYDISKENIQPNTVIILDNNNIRLTFVESQQGTILIQQGKL